MIFRTDLALEQHEESAETPEGIELEEIAFGDAKITTITIINEQGAQAIGKPAGRYVTIEIPPLSDDAVLNDDAVTAIKGELSRMTPREGTVLVVGLGNTDITPDALGPKAALSVLATRHITGELARSAGLDDLRPVCVLAPGVLGQTGIETSEIVQSVCRHIKPSAVLAIDALASRQLSRLGCTVQLSDTGISPGAGVGNARKELSENTLGVPVISLGVPTVVDAATVAYDLTGAEPPQDKVSPRGQPMIVTPREIDLIIKRAAEMISHSVNCALQPGIDAATLLELCC